jgi:hypothetical protein
MKFDCGLFIKLCAHLCSVVIIILLLTFSINNGSSLVQRGKISGVSFRCRLSENRSMVWRLPVRNLVNRRCDSVSDPMRAGALARVAVGLSMMVV